VTRLAGPFVFNFEISGVLRKICSDDGTEPIIKKVGSKPLAFKFSFYPKINCLRRPVWPCFEATTGN
jgi:hypothetical protein